MTNKPLTWQAVSKALTTFYHINASTFLIIMVPTTIEWYLLGTYTLLVGQILFYVGAALWLITGLIDLSLMVSRLIRLTYHAHDRRAGIHTQGDMAEGYARPAGASVLRPQPA